MVDKTCGFVVDEGNVEQLLDCIDKIKQAPLSFDVGLQQRKFDKNESYKKYLDIYKVVRESEK